MQASKKKAGSVSGDNYLKQIRALWPHPNQVMTSHLETGQVETETKGIYDHGCPTTQGTLTHTASPPATDHPGAPHVNSVKQSCGKKIEKNSCTQKKLENTSMNCVPGMMRGLHVCISLKWYWSSAVACGGIPTLIIVNCSSWIGARVSKCCSRIWGLMQNIQVVQRLISVAGYKKTNI